MKEITRNKKYVLSLVDPDEVFDILGKGNGEGLFCRVIKGRFQKATHELRNLKVSDIKNYISAAKNNDPNEFIIFYRVVENKTYDDAATKVKPVTGKYAVLKTPDGTDVRIFLDIIKKAHECCNTYDCDDPKNPCPFKEGGANTRFRDLFDRGCLDIFEMYWRGEYRIEEV